MLKYSLYDNPVTPDPTDFMAIVQDSEKVTVEELIQEVTVPGSILKETECVAVFHAILKALGKKLHEGKGFASEYLVLDHSIKGVFTSEDDTLDPNRHQVNINVRLGSTLRDMTKKVPTTKVKATVPVPVLERVYDHWTQTTNDQLTPRSSVDLMGENLKIGDLEDANQGIYLIDSKGVETRVDRVSQNKPKQLVFSVPEGLAKGNYTLEVRTILKHTSKIRQGRLNEILVVA